MPIEIIQERVTETGVEYDLCFDRVGSPGCGFSFPCDAQGNPDWDRMHPEGIANLGRCLCGDVAVVFCGIAKREWSYTTPRMGRCDCGEEIFLDRFTNTCDCGADYNSAGQRLAPREQWGEETGESWHDCMF